MSDNPNRFNQFNDWLKRTFKSKGNPGLLEQIEKAKPTYNEMSLSQLEKVIEDVMFNDQKDNVMGTGLGGLVEYVNTSINLDGDYKGFYKNADSVLMFVELDWSFSDKGQGDGPLYVIHTKPFKKPMKEKALFLDLEGTLIKSKSGDLYWKDSNDWEFIPGVIQKVKMYKNAGYYICIISNQGGIESLKVSQIEVERLLDNVGKELEQYIGGGISHAYCGNIDGYMKKPNPGMAYRLALELELSLRHSVMVGDTESDAQFAKNAYIGTYLDIKDFIEETSVRTWDNK